MEEVTVDVHSQAAVQFMTTIAVVMMAEMEKVGVPIMKKVADTLAGLQIDTSTQEGRLVVNWARGFAEVIREYPPKRR